MEEYNAGNPPPSIGEIIANLMSSNIYKKITLRNMRGGGERIQQKWDARKEKRFLRDNIEFKEGNLTKRKM